LNSSSGGREAAMPLVYALVARAADAVVLAQHAVVNGNFQAVALECLDRARSGGEERFSITCAGQARRRRRPNA
jgi:hypothetical protein